MRVDQTHRPWLIGTAAALLISLAVYATVAVRFREIPRGGSPLGLTFGIAGFLLMLFAGLLGLRKRFPVWRVGRVQNWMRAHLWLGMLSFLLVLLHSAFTLGGTLTTILMMLFIGVTLSGIYGALLQHFLPRILTVEAPMETIYDEIGVIREQLWDESKTLLEDLLRQGELTGNSSKPISIVESPTAQVRVTEVDEQSASALRNFFETEMEPYVRSPRSKSILAEPALRKAMFKQLSVLLPPERQPMLEELEGICEEKRQLDRQAKLHRWLHIWLLVHVPLSYLVLLLAVVHAFMALRY
ncbi:MAG: ferric reductase-like transmembrane domain-containing protein [Terriglobales bacterium]